MLFRSQFTEVEFKDTMPIDGYGPGFFRVGGKVFEGAVLVLPTSVTAWGGYGDAGALLALRVDVLFIGTGIETTHIPKPLREALEEAHCGGVIACLELCAKEILCLRRGYLENNDGARIWRFSRWAHWGIRVIWN